ncbi:uncharacterized protein SPPG_08163 [Spizellomyces punctatus DAOM BR117]|uniref:Uncharacterized protein n=1 Tax=Spizellomyces punctatus (strain DAOM BR117) TaxID=645134 RepID=A0A0L0H7A3_SPIPD|nr:uncharacterized protein SPPG_08163 [Spizellomyces punctatus DAOM BR117]KNC96578.1 hypothetical protein SPPG_08163 [Spizellomyces punctatus DAOM BR117]|eukprot:XP_016604618.1 hypothetical protein SPPG_08163 [Spizellomyces punctatus DAOM BR117]
MFLFKKTVQRFMSAIFLFALQPHHLKIINYAYLINFARVRDAQRPKASSNATLASRAVMYHSALSRIMFRRRLILLLIIATTFLFLSWWPSSSSKSSLRHSKDTSQLTEGFLYTQEDDTVADQSGYKWEDVPLSQSPLNTTFEDMPNLRARILAFSNAFQYSKSRKPVEDAIRLLYPWLPVNEISVLRGKGRGLVYTFGDHDLALAYPLIVGMRLVHRCKLPIEIWYMGEEDLSASNRELLAKIPGVKCKDLTKVIDISIAGYGGWGAKPFALLASSFAEPIFMDADAVFFKDPSALYAHPGYIGTGAVFFHDRTSGWVGSAKDLQWLLSVIPNPSSRTYGSRYIYGKSQHEQESGVVVINKARVFPGLLAACLLNSKPWASKVYQRVWGDKETFWIGFEMSGIPYAWNPGYGGAMGQFSGDKLRVCGRQLAHGDHQGALLWVNNGLRTPQKLPPSKHAQPSIWMNDRSGFNLDWTTDGSDCLLATAGIPTELTAKEKQIWDAFVKIDAHLTAKGMDYPVALELNI